MMTFGPWDDAPIAQETQRWPVVPVGVCCLYCDEAVAAGDAGAVTPYLGGGVAARHRVPGPAGVDLVVQHRECLVAQTCGHLVGVCSCTGWGLGSRDTAREVMRRLDQHAADRTGRP